VHRKATEACTKARAEVLSEGGITVQRRKQTKSRGDALHASVEEKVAELVCVREYEGESAQIASDGGPTDAPAGSAPYPHPTVA
jgi:hypothetical protein